MKRIPTFLAASAATALLLTATASQAPAGQSDFHLELTRSHPAADTVLPSPGEIRLWFESSALRPTCLCTSGSYSRQEYTESGSQPVAGYCPLHHTKPAARRASSFCAQPVTVTETRCTALFM